MIKKIFFTILLLNLLNHCEYKPVYSNQNKLNQKIIITSFTGDKEINNLIASSLKRNSKKDSDKILNISFDTKYNKKVLVKNAAGEITDFQADVIVKFKIEKEDKTENFSINEKFNFQKMTDKYEEKNYERNIKNNFANSISQKLLLRMAVYK